MAGQRRRWFQLSLTTCIVMMLVAGVLGWVNSISKTSRLRDYPRKGQRPPYDKVVTRYGWPISAEVERSEGGITASIYFADAVGVGSIWTLIVPNFVAALAILTATATLSEYLIRRRGQSKLEVEA